MILDSSILVAFEKRRFDLERLLLDRSPAAIAAITAAELLIGVHRADTPERRSRREEFVEKLFARMPIVHSTSRLHDFTQSTLRNYRNAARSSATAICKSRQQH